MKTRQVFARMLTEVLTCDNDEEKSLCATYYLRKNVEKTERKIPYFLRDSLRKFPFFPMM